MVGLFMNFSRLTDNPGSAVRRHTGVIAALMLQVSAVGWSDQASMAPKCSNTTGSE
jgi:hypothetical protein